MGASGVGGCHFGPRHKVRVFFFFTIDNGNLEISGFRFTKIDLSWPPGGVGSSYLERLEVFMCVLSIFNEKYLW